MLTISGKALGRKKPLFADFSVPLNPTSEAGVMTLRKLIDGVVRGEVIAFKDRQAERGLLKSLSPQQIEAGLAKGKVDMGGRDLKQVVDVDQAIATALEAFTDGIYIVVLDDVELKSLDDPIQVQPDSRVTFVRLAMLAGG